MTRLGRAFRNLVERLFSRYYEGPQPPQRLAEQVVAFAAANPQATVAEWMRYASALAQRSYQMGYTRGLEWAERDLDMLDLGDPERLAEQARADFSWHAPHQPTATQMAMVVPRGPQEFLDDLPNDKARAQALDMLGRYGGNFRVVLVPRSPPTRHDRKA